MYSKDLKDLIIQSKGEQKADLVFKNANIINVFTNEIISGDLAISKGLIVGIGEGYQGVKEIDMTGKYLSPGLIDGHVHIESSMVGPREFSKAIVPRGVTTIVADPHEIANVKGLEGIEYIIKESEGLPLDVYIMFPSCVPATPFENSGAILRAEDFEKMIDRERMLGLGEMMNYPGVISSDEDILKKIGLSKSRGKTVDGHAPNVGGKGLNAYILAGVETDHECSNIDEMMEKLRLGMYIHIREGSAARNLKDLIAGVNKDNLRRCMFCTDDKHPKDIREDGSVDYNIRLAIKSGLDPIDCIKMASLNIAECYGLKGRGALAPGYLADILVLDNLEEFNVVKVYKNGRLVGENLKPNFEIENKVDIGNMVNSVNLLDISIEDFDIYLDSERVNVIKLVPNNLVTKKVERKVAIKEGKFVSGKDILKIAVVERHRATGNIGLGLIEGFGLKNGAIATTVGHDSHNLIVVGDNDEDMLRAVEEIEKIKGGYVIVSGGEVLGSLSLAIGGLMSDRNLDYVIDKVDELTSVAREKLGVRKDYDPFITLSFMALPVIPDIKLTDMGLFYVPDFDFIDLEIRDGE